MVGFLTHSGFAHGGNGFEGMQFLLEQFGGENGIADPGQPQHGLDLTAMATAFTTAYKQEKAKRKEVAEGGRAIPGINHPVFRGKPVNTDPREVFVRKLIEERGETNVFHDYYHAVARALFDQGVTRNVFAVNIDAVIAAWLLKLLWQPYREGRLSAEQLETAAFSLFLYARMAGSAAEIEDHVNRGRNMDTRTAASACRFVS
jgi:citrate synthase